MRTRHRRQDADATLSKSQATRWSCSRLGSFNSSPIATAASRGLARQVAAATNCYDRRNSASTALRARTHPSLEQNFLQRTKPRERRLEKIEPDKSRQEEPPWVHEMAEGQTGQHERAGHEIDDALNFHTGILARPPLDSTLPVMGYDLGKRASSKR